MASWREFLQTGGYEQFEEVRKLDEKSKDDPEDNPFQSRYQSRKILQTVQEKLKKYEEGNAGEDLRFLLAAVELKIGINFIDTEELSSGEEAVNRCLDDLEKFCLDKRAFNIYHSALNQLGILWTGRRVPKKALENLQKAESLYNEFKHQVGGAPHAFEEHFKSSSDNEDQLEQNRSMAFESTYTHTLYYMAQVYAKLEETEKSAYYCHTTLQRQLEAQDYDPLDWSINCATLSQYYITADNLPRARHCLASSSMVFQQAEAKSAGSESDAVKEKLLQSKADIDRCWAKYGLSVLELSRDYLLNEVKKMDDQNRFDVGDHNDDKQTDDSSEEAAANTSDYKDSKVFPRFNLELTLFEDQITDKFVRDFSEARQVFLLVQKWLNSAKEFYILGGHCTDHVEITQDHSKAFKSLIFFEMDLERQCKMHKRRIDMISALLTELNQQHYLLVCRQLMYEMAETYSSMLDTKLAQIELEGETPTPHAVKKINLLTQQSIEQYHAFINSFQDNKKQLPEEFPESDLRPVLVAYFCVGRLYSKFLMSDLRQRLAYIKKSIEGYKCVVDYCHKHPTAQDVVPTELDICQEMVALLPVKMERLIQENV